MFFGDFLAPRKSLARQGETRQSCRPSQLLNDLTRWSGNYPLPTSPFTGGGEKRQMRVLTNLLDE